MTHKKNQEFIPVGEKTSIFRRGRIWYVNFQFEHRQIRHSLKTTSKKEAMLRAQKIETANKNAGGDYEIIDASIDDVIMAFLEAAVAQDRAPKTLVKYRFVCNQIGHLAAQRTLRRPVQLDARFADAYQAVLKKSGKAAKTIYNSMVILRSIILFAISRKMCATDPLPNYKLRKPKPTTQPCWTPEDADRIIGASPPTYRPYLLFLRETGCRAGEAKYLTWRDIDLRDGKFHIRPKEGWKPKTGDHRVVPMTDRVLELLKSLPHNGHWVFTAPPTAQHPQPDRQISERRALQALKRVLKPLQLEGHLHTFRHTFISQALMRNVPEATVRKLVGHVDEDILRSYTHVSNDAMRIAIERFSTGGMMPPVGGEERTA